MIGQFCGRSFEPYSWPVRDLLTFSTWRLFLLDSGCPQWLLDDCFWNAVMLVAAEYRLVPDSIGLDILEDIRELCIWFLTNRIPGIEADLSKVLAHGKSASRAFDVQSVL